MTQPLLDVFHCPLLQSRTMSFLLGTLSSRTYMTCGIASLVHCIDVQRPVLQHNNIRVAIVYASNNVL